MDVYTTDFAFRLIFNGKILTHLVEGCPPDAELCDIIHFQKQVDPIATRSEEVCWAPEEEAPNEIIVQAKTLMSTKEGILLFVGLVLVSATIGAVATFVLLTGRLPFTTQKVMAGVMEEDDEVDEGERRGLQDYFEDEPVVEDQFVNGQS
jgi:hypothetical protein